MGQFLKKAAALLLSRAPLVAILLVLAGLLHTTPAVELAHQGMISAGLVDFNAPAVATSEDFDFDFTIKDLNGNKKYFADLKGKVVFLNLWATWCGPCRAEMAGIESLYRKINNDQIAFVMLSIDRDSDHNKLVDYLNTKGFTFPVYQPSGQRPEQLRVPSIPTTFIISKTGKVVTRKVGTTNYDTKKFKMYLEKLAAETL